MSQPNSSYFHAGKAARQAGKICMNTDARLSQQHRDEWYEGWNYQDGLMRGPPEAEVVAQNDDFFANLRAELRKGQA